MTAGRREFHPVADIFPMMSDREFLDLVDDIREHGLREPIWLHPDGRIIDGRNRYLACIELDDDPPVRTYRGDESELVAFVVSLNLHRRHLNESQRAMIAARVAEMRQGERTDLAPNGARSQADAAELLNVSRRSVQRAKRVADQGGPELAAMVEAGDVPVSMAAEVADEVATETAKSPGRARDIAAAAVEKKRAEMAKRRQKVQDIEQHNEWARQVNEDIHPETKADLDDLGRRTRAVVAISMGCEALLDQVRDIDPTSAITEAPPELLHKLTTVHEAQAFLAAAAEALSSLEVRA